MNENSGIIGVGEGKMNVLPRYAEAVIPIEKFINYALNPEKDTNKATAFNLALGFKLEHAGILITAIKNNLSYYPAIPKGNSGHGMRYEVVMNITGINGKTAKVLTAWIDDKESGEMRLTNAYVDKKKKGEKP